MKGHGDDDAPWIGHLRGEPPGDAGDHRGADIGTSFLDRLAEAVAHVGRDDRARVAVGGHLILGIPCKIDLRRHLVGGADQASGPTSEPS